MKKLILAGVVAAIAAAGGAVSANTTVALQAVPGGYDVVFTTDSELDLVTAGVFPTDPPCADWQFVWDNDRLVTQGLQPAEFLDPGPLGTVGLEKIGSFAVVPSESGLDYFAIQGTTVLGGLFGSSASPLNGPAETTFRLGTLLTQCPVVLAESTHLEPAFGTLQVRAYQPGDRDADLVADLEDNCMFAANPTQDDLNVDDIGDACQCGDVDNNGVVNTTDALRIARGLVTDPEALARCDVSGDPEGACNTTDALRIARGLAVFADQLEQPCPAAHELSSGPE